MGLAVHLSYLALALTTNVIICVLLRPVQPILARLALIFSLIGLTIEATTLQHLLVPLAMIEDGDELTALGEGQMHALTYLHLRLFANGWGIALFFFAGFCVLTGILIRRSRLIPGLLGAMMIVVGVCYLINSMGIILSPGLSSLLVPWILVPCAVGELSLALWLTVKGVRTEAPPGG